MTNNEQKQLLDHLSTAVVLLDSNLSIIGLNTAAEALLALSFQQAEGLKVTKYFHESAEALKDLQRAFADNLQYTKRKTRWRLHNGKHITVDYTVTPIHDSNRIVLELQRLDRLLRISREEEMSASQETTQTLIRGLAHEVKNPLGGIRGAAQLLHKELGTNDLTEYTDVIVAESDRLRNLVDRMLGPRKQPDLLPINIHEVLERVCTIISAETQQQIRLTRNYDPSIPDIQGDTEMLIQAVLNIARNAMQALLTQHSNNAAEITFSTRIDRKFTTSKAYYPLVVKISVEDNGPGIPEDIVKHIFHPMISGRAEGTGLGLSISQQLINQHKGLIECSSEPGNTIFSIYIPLENS